jgi:hypothetical protein
LSTTNEVNLIVGPASTVPPGFMPGSISYVPASGVSLIATGAIGATYHLWATTNIALQRRRGIFVANEGRKSEHRRCGIILAWKATNMSLLRSKPPPSSIFHPLWLRLSWWRAKTSCGGADGETDLTERQ